MATANREYCLRWNNHQPNFVSFFSSLLAKESFVDVSLISSEGRKLQAHKLVLSACSPYFQHVFESNPCKHPVVILKDINYYDLKTIVNFMYNGEVNISQDRINAILALANTLQVKGLAEVPAEELKRVGGGSRVPNSVLDSTPGKLLKQDSADNNENEVPGAKRFKKALGGSNGDHTSSASFESGVGASVSRSVEDGNATTSRTGSPLERERPRVPGGPPPLTAANIKSKSLDTTNDPDPVIIDSESSGGYPENQNYDESTDKGAFVEIADVKIEAVSDDGEIEFDDYENADDENFDETDPANMTFPGASASSSFFSNSIHFSSRRDSWRLGRRGRPLLRQRRVKRTDADGKEIETDLPDQPNLTRSFSFDYEDEELERPSSAPDLRRKSPSPIPETSQKSSIIKLTSSTSVPIVTVSQSSPTPPSSPLPTSTSFPKDSLDEYPIGLMNRGSLSISPVEKPLIGNTLLTVPDSVSISPVPVVATSSQLASVHTVTIGGHQHLVKQVSQPLLPSHHASVLSQVGVTSSIHYHHGSSTPTIRRQYSQPNPAIHQPQLQHQHLVPLESLKRGTIFTLTPSGSLEGRRESPEREHGGPSNTIIFEPSSLIQIVSSGNLEKSHGKTGGFLSSGSPLIKGESFDSSPNFSGSTEDSPHESSFLDDPLGQPRSGHCPALRPGPALGCNFCWNSVDSCGRILRRKTKYHCPECHINLCIVPCFQEYHEKISKKKRAKSKLGLPKPSSM